MKPPFWLINLAFNRLLFENGCLLCKKALSTSFECPVRTFFRFSSLFAPILQISSHFIQCLLLLGIKALQHPASSLVQRKQREDFIS